MVANDDRRNTDIEGSFGRPDFGKQTIAQGNVSTRYSSPYIVVNISFARGSGLWRVARAVCDAASNGGDTRIHVMRFLIYGAGAVGGVIGARLRLAGHEVALICRGDHLTAIQRNGLTLRAPDGEY
ncbi:MAG: hypothetical protein NZ518_04425, partial [Dehalococcoidia bacterium]|nr:hypothetical protein [Dehalococcoidia bacterium]